METRVFQTNLNCASCVAVVRPLLDADASIIRWNVDTEDERKPLTVAGETVSSDHVRKLVEQAGFQVLGEVTEEGSRVSETAVSAEATRPWIRAHFPLLLIFGYLLLGVVASEGVRGRFDPMRAMRHFMGGFFFFFSFFKLLNLPKFADAYQTYDILARRSRSYALIYPFIELALGLAFFSEANPAITHWAALAVMGVSSIGVIQSLLKGRKIQCACLGTIFELPMSKITLFEDLLMAAMAAAGLVIGN